MTQKVLVLADVDGVCAAFDDRAREVCELNKWVLDHDHPSKQTKRFLTDHIPDKHHRNQLRKHIDTTPFFADLDLIEGCYEGIMELASKTELHFCSKPLDANVSCASDKVAWIKRHFPKLHGRLILAGDKSLIQGDVLLDDAPKLKWLERATWTPVVYSHPFNSHPESELYNLPHFKWGDPIENIIEIAKEHRYAKA